MTVAEMAAICRTLPKVTEDVKWGNDLVFSIGGKMFAVIDAEEGGSGRYSFKCAPGQFEMMIGRGGIIPAPYMARAQWVSIQEPDALDSDEAKECIENSYRLVVERMTKKLRTELGV